MVVLCPAQDFTVLYQVTHDTQRTDRYRSGRLPEWHRLMTSFLLIQYGFCQHTVAERKTRFSDGFWVSNKL